MAPEPVEYGVFAYARVVGRGDQPAGALLLLPVGLVAEYRSGALLGKKHVWLVHTWKGTPAALDALKVWPTKLTGQGADDVLLHVAQRLVALATGTIHRVQVRRALVGAGAVVEASELGALVRVCLGHSRDGDRSPPMMQDWSPLRPGQRWRSSQGPGWRHQAQKSSRSGPSPPRWCGTPRDPRSRRW
jgi:hypothetical protein